MNIKILEDMRNNEVVKKQMIEENRGGVKGRAG